MKNCPPRRSRGSSPSAQARCGCACPGGGVSFARARYSLASLTKLQEQICAQLSVKAVLSSCALDEENNRLVLSLTRADDEALSALAVLDPRDDAVYVQAAAPASAESGTGTACPRASR